MKNTLAQNRQLFNVKDIAYSTTMDNLAEGQIGIFAEGSNTSIASTVDTFAELPEKFVILSKLGGKVYYSFDTISKNSIKDIMFKEYQAQAVNIWKTTINHCECVEGFYIKLNISEASLIQRDGMTWAHSDFIVGVTAEEIDCQCQDGVLSGYDNNIVTKMAVEKINAINSPFYEAEAQTLAGATITDIDAFIATNKTVNQDADTTNDVLMQLVIKGKAQPAPLYRDLEVNYVFPRGVKLNPAISVNNGAKSFEFTQTQALQYEIGAGYDVRAEEFDNMSNFTNLNYYPQLSDGIQNPYLVYQFENNTNYDTLTFEFSTDKVEANSGEKRNFCIIFGVEDGTDSSTELKNLFTA
jgi:hypothetical protein